MQQEIAIVGMAGRFPMSPNIDVFWQNLLAGQNCICKNKRFPDILEWGGFLEDVEYFDAKFFEIAPQDARTMDPRQRLFMETAYHALEDAGYGGKRAYGSMTGVFVGASNNQYALLLDKSGCANKAINNANASIANRLSYFMDFRGPSMVLDSTCSSATLALHQACLSLWAGECEMALVGGVHLLLASGAAAALQNMMVVSKSGRNCAFSRNANGFVPGEGVGCAVLKPLESAQKDGDRIYAVIQAMGVNYAGKTDGFMRSNPTAQTDLVAGVLQKTQIKTANLRYLELSGTGTVPGDFQEFQAIAQALTETGGNSSSCACGTVKNNIGNLDPASGIAALIKVALILSRKKIPPLIHASPINRFIRPNTPLYLCEKGEDLDKTHSVRAGMISFGVTGVNVFALLQEAPALSFETTNKSLAERVIALSGHDLKSLKKNTACLRKFLHKHSQIELADICHTANIGRGHFGSRLAVTSTCSAELAEKLALLSENFASRPDLEIFVSCKKDKPVVSGQKNAKNFMHAYRANALGEKQEHTREFYSINQPDIVFYFPTPSSRNLTPEQVFSLVKSPGYDWALSNILQELGSRKSFRKKARLDVFISYYAFARMLATWGVRAHRIACGLGSLPLALAISGQMSLKQALTIKNRNLCEVFSEQKSNVKIILCEGEDVPKVIADAIGKTQCYSKVEDMLDFLRPEVAIAFAPTLVQEFVDRPGFFQPIAKPNGLMSMIAKLYALKVEIAWENFEYNLPGKTISLPGYQFTRKRYWFETQRDQTVHQAETQRDQTVHQAKQIPSLQTKSTGDIAALSDFLKQSIASHYGYDSGDIEDDRPLSSYGIDSLFLLSISEALSKKFGIPLDAADLFSHSTISGIVSYLCDSTQKLQEAFPDKKSDEGRISAKPKSGDLAVIGMSAHFPGAPDVNAFWENILHSRVSIREVPPARWDIEKLYHPLPGTPGKSCSKWAGIIDGLDEFEALFFDLHPKEAGAMDPQQRLALVQSWKAIENAGIPAKDLANTSTGVFVGCSNFEYSAQVCKRPPEKITAHDALGTSHSLIANRVSHFLKLKGPSFAIDATCSSATAALHLAAQSIAVGECEAAIVLGVNLALDASTFISLSRARMLSPGGICRIFADDADGTVRGEGAAAIFIKPLEKAEKDNDIIYGVIEATAMRYKGQSIGITLPSVEGIEDVMTTAWKRANIDPKTISYLELGSFGSKVADPIEFFAIKRAFAKYTSHTGFCALGSVKPNIGHLEAASGMAALIKTLLVAKHGKIPVMLNLKKTNPAIDLKSSAFYFNKELQEKPIVRTAFNSLGFGGSIAHVVVKSYVTIAREREIFPDVCCISALSFPSLRQKINDLLKYLKKSRKWSLNDVCYTLNAGRTHFHKYRLAFIAESDEKLLQELAKIEKELAKLDSDRKFRVQNNEKKPAMLFTENFPSQKMALEIVSLYRQGFTPDWNAYYREASLRKMELPVYPFRCQRPLK